MPGPYPKEFREDVVAVARSRESGVTIKQIATDFGISEATLQNWLRQVSIWRLECHWVLRFRATRY